MPKRGTGLLCSFLVRHLNAETFGDKLLWIDRKKGVFQLLWEHGNCCSLDRDKDHAVFAAWDKLKHRRSSEDAQKGCKHRFRVAINKMKIKKLSSWKGKTPERHYQFRRIPQEDLDLIKTSKRFEVPRSPEINSGSSKECTWYQDSSIDSTTHYDVGDEDNDNDEDDDLMMKFSEEMTNLYSFPQAEMCTDVAGLLACRSVTDTLEDATHSANAQRNANSQCVPNSEAVRHSAASSTILEYSSCDPTTISSFSLKLDESSSSCKQKEEDSNGPVTLFLQCLQESRFDDKALTVLLDTMKDSGLQWLA